MENKKKILHIIQSLDNGGCENMLLRALPLLSDFHHVIVTLKSPGTLFPEFQKSTTVVHTVGLRHLLDLSGLLRLRKKVRAEAPDLIITYLLHADILGRLWLPLVSKTKVIPFLRTTYNHPRYQLARVFERLTRSLVPRYFANSEAVKNFYVKNIGVPAKKISVIPNGIDVEYFKNIKPSSALRNSFGITPEEKVVICVANLHPNKGHYSLLEAFEEVSKTSPKTCILLVGDGEEKKSLLHQIEHFSSKKNVHFLGQRQDVPKLLALANIFVLPTFFEGMSNALLEAMAAGLPVITTDIPENRLLITDRKDGLLVSPGSAHELTLKLKEVLENPLLAQALGNHAQKKVIEEFDIQKTTEKFRTALEKIL